MRKVVSLLLILALIFPLAAQNAENENEEPILDLTPAPYTDDEFPQWTRDLRRAEIIFFGSTPFTFLFSAVGYRTGKYIWNNMTAESGVDIPGWNDLEQADQVNMVFIGLGFSLTIAVVDFILGHVERKQNDQS